MRVKFHWKSFSWHVKSTQCPSLIKSRREKKKIKECRFFSLWRKNIICFKNVTECFRRKKNSNSRQNLIEFKFHGKWINLHDKEVKCLRACSECFLVVFWSIKQTWTYFIYRDKHNFYWFSSLLMFVWIEKDRNYRDKKGFFSFYTH